VITITGSHDHLRPDSMISFTGIRNLLQHPLPPLGRTSASAAPFLVASDVWLRMSSKLPWA
jgi:hypothetical protein